MPMIPPPLSINHFLSLGTISYSSFTVLPHLIVPPLIREQLSITCDDAYFISKTLATPILPHKSQINTCSFNILSQTQNLSTGFLFASHHSLFPVYLLTIHYSLPALQRSPLGLSVHFLIRLIRSLNIPLSITSIRKNSRATLRYSKKKQTNLIRKPHGHSSRIMIHPPFTINHDPRHRNGVKLSYNLLKENT